jgi:hypothetical protein
MLTDTDKLLLKADAKKDKEKEKYETESDSEFKNNGYIEIEQRWSWNYKLNDGILTYQIDTNNKLFNALIDTAMIEWEDALGDLIKFEKLDNHAFYLGRADIIFDSIKSFEDCEKCWSNEKNHQYDGIVEKGRHTIAAATGVSGEKSTGLMRGAIIVVALEDYLYKFKDGYTGITKFEILQDIRNNVKHEIGHALGLGHANNKQSLMYYKIDGVENKPVTDCDAYHVFLTNGFFDYAAYMEDDYAYEHPDEIETIQDAYEKICKL